MSVYVAKSTDGSAPTLSGTAGDLVNLLDKLLCDGFGSYTAPGWTKEFTDTNKRVYRAPSGNRFYLRVDDSGSGSAEYARVIGYESMSDVDTGTGPFPTNAQVSGGLYVTKSSEASGTARDWRFYSDGVVFYLLVNYSGSSWVIALEFGDQYALSGSDSFCTYIAASRAAGVAFSDLKTDQSVAAIGAASGSAAGYYFARSYTGAGGSIACAARSPFRSGAISSSVVYTYPSPIVGGMVMDMLDLVENTSNTGPRALMKGKWDTPHNLHAAGGVADLDTFSGASGSALSGRTFEITKSTFQSAVLIFETSDTWGP